MHGMQPAATLCRFIICLVFCTWEQFLSVKCKLEPSSGHNCAPNIPIPNVIFRQKVIWALVLHISQFVNAPHQPIQLHMQIHIYWTHTFGDFFVFSNDFFFLLVSRAIATYVRGTAASQLTKNVSVKTSLSIDIVTYYSTCAVCPRRLRFMKELFSRLVRPNNHWSIPRDVQVLSINRQSAYNVRYRVGQMLENVQKWFSLRFHWQ